MRGQHLLNLDIGLPVQRLRNRLKVCLTGGNSIEPEMLEAVNRRGKKIAFQVTCAPLYGSDGMVTGGILVMDEIPGPGADRTVS